MLRAMIVEDYIFFRETFRNWLLSQHPSMEVVEAGNGKEALRRLGSSVFDLVFMDIHLPGENGFEITRKIKAGWKDVAVVMITSYDIPEYRGAAIGYGANSFVAKDSLKWAEISAMVSCFQRAKDTIGLKPSCVRLATEST